MHLLSYSCNALITIPAPIQAAICMKFSGDGFSNPRVAATPDDTPIIPRAFPTENKISNKISYQVYVHELQHSKIGL